MFIFKEERGNIKTYLLNPNIKKVREFKKEEIEKTPCQNRVLEAIGTSKVLLNDQVNIGWNNLINHGYNIDGMGVYHYLKWYEQTKDEAVRQLNLLKKYYDGYFDDRRIVKISEYGRDKGSYDFSKGVEYICDDEGNLDKVVPILEDRKSLYEISKDIEYLLITKDYKQMGPQFVMNDIIVLTKPLYLYETFLRAINNYDYKSVADIDIDKILPYFDICEGTYKPFAKDRIRDMFDARLMNLVSLEAYYPDFMKNIDQSNMIAEKALKLSNKIF